jgi:hypothetical protein
VLHHDPAAETNTAKGKGGRPEQFTADDLKHLQLLRSQGLTTREIAERVQRVRRSEVDRALEHLKMVLDSRKWTVKDRAEAHEALRLAQARAKVSVRTVARRLDEIAKLDRPLKKRPLKQRSPAPRS